MRKDRQKRTVRQAKDLRIVENELEEGGGGECGVGRFEVREDFAFGRSIFDRIEEIFVELRRLKCSLFLCRF